MKTLMTLMFLSLLVGDVKASPPQDMLAHRLPTTPIVVEKQEPIVVISPVTPPVLEVPAVQYSQPLPVVSQPIFRPLQVIRQPVFRPVQSFRNCGPTG